MGAMCDLFVQTETFVLFLACITIKNRLPVPLPLEHGSKGFSAEWIQNFLGHESYKTTMDMYGTLSIDEMQEVAARLLA